MSGAAFTILDFHRMSAIELDTLVSHATTLRCAAEAGTHRAPLHGRNLGLMSSTTTSDAAERFHHAATALGAKVSRIEPRLTPWSSSTELRQTARLLGRLYDGVECQGMAAALVREMSEHAGVPFFEGIAAHDHPTASLAERVGGRSAEENRRFVVQAILLEALI
ncbi:MAG: ornithine carbamoyltransferase [Proteobacteria bacterium]|nr:ornithine carbamoyltransferase [Pseudomonadota bacterium]